MILGGDRCGSLNVDVGPNALQSQIESPGYIKLK